MALALRSRAASLVPLFRALKQAEQRPPLKKALRESHESKLRELRIEGELLKGRRGEKLNLVEFLGAKHVESA